MRKINLLILSLLLSSFHLFASEYKIINEPGDPASENAIIVNSAARKIILQTSNGCGIGNYLIPSTGDSSLNIPPVIGSISDNISDLEYKIHDTLPGFKIKGVAFQRALWWFNNGNIISETSLLYPYIVVTDSGIFSYTYDIRFSPTDYNEIFRIQSVFKPDILKMARQNTKDKTDPIVLLIDDPVNKYKIHFYSYPDLQELFSFPFHFEPEIFEVVDSNLFITGRDTSGSYQLYHFSSIQDTLFASYILNDTASNAQEIIVHGDSIFILSSPGDSMIAITALNMTNSSLSQNIVYQNSAARATFNEYRNNKNFTFQTTSVLPDSFLNKQILILDPITVQIDTLLINREVDQFKHPEPSPSGFGYFSMGWIAAKWNGSTNDSVFISDEFLANIYRLETAAKPNYIYATFSCWIGIPENELKKINFKAYPNPASSEVVISLSGLQKGKKYHLSISDISGRIYFTTGLEAYEEINLPINNYPKGVYYINLNTGKNIITRKLIIQ